MFRVLKFGGTSVGSAQRMKDLVRLTAHSEPKIVVLSAMSGTTNTLVEICESLYAKDAEKTKKLTETLRQKYQKEVAELFSKETSLTKANHLILHHFNFIEAFTMDMFTPNEEKAILAQVE